MYLLGAEELAAVATVVASLVEGEAYRAWRAAVCSLVLEPVVGHAAPRLVRHTPREHTASCVSHIHCAVVPVMYNRVSFTLCDGCQSILAFTIFEMKLRETYQLRINTYFFHAKIYTIFIIEFYMILFKNRVIEQVFLIIKYTQLCLKKDSLKIVF